MRIVAIVPAFQNESMIGSTVAALLGDSRLAEVIVVDDGSSDGTASTAEAAGARVIRVPDNVGKGGALERALDVLGETEVVLLVDADTGTSARHVMGLVKHIESGQADMVVGVLPSAGGKGGFGLVRRLASFLIKSITGFESRAPLSGQRAIRAVLLHDCRPLARGFGVDSALTADAVSRGYRVLEVDVSMTHSHRGRRISGFSHRARQGRDILAALFPRVLERGRTRDHK